MYMCMYICVFVYMCVRVCVYAYIHIYIPTHTHFFTHTYILHIHIFFKCFPGRMMSRVNLEALALTINK